MIFICFYWLNVLPVPFKIQDEAALRGNLDVSSNRFEPALQFRVEILINQGISKPDLHVPCGNIN